jgi:hypothetical protein
MPPSLAEVTIQRSSCLDPQPDHPVSGAAAPARLAHHIHDSVAQVDVGHLEAGQLRQPEPAVQEQHDDAASRREVKSGPDAGDEQGPQGLVGQHRSLRITWGPAF